jgi:hypothetical protein
MQWTLAPVREGVRLTGSTREDLAVSSDMPTNAKLPLAALLLALTATTASAQQPPTTPPKPYPVGNPLGMPVLPTPDRPFKPVTPNVKVFGSVYSAESCSYDAERGVIVVPNRGVPPAVRMNDAWISFFNHDGSVHTSRWVGVQPAGPARNTLSPPLLLNEPYGSDIVKGVLYLADRDGGNVPGTAPTSVLRRFDMRTGAPLGDIRIAGAAPFNDIAVTVEGTIYGTVTATSELWRVTPSAEASMFVAGAPLNRPNGIALDGQGNIVVVNIGSDSVLTFSREGKLVRTERAVQAGNDGLVIMSDGTKYVSSVLQGGVSRIRAGKPAELIAENIPSAASMCYDAGAKQLVIPMNDNNGLAFIRIR